MQSHFTLSKIEFCGHVNLHWGKHWPATNSYPGSHTHWHLLLSSFEKNGHVILQFGMQPRMGSGMVGIKPSLQKHSHAVTLTRELGGQSLSHFDLQPVYVPEVTE